MVPIQERDPAAADRRVPGHWEGDLVIGKNGASAAITLVERVSWYTVILALPDGKDSAGVALIEYCSELPAMMRKSLTWDQGTEMVRHAAVTLATDLKVYFADPRSPWQRPLEREHQRTDPRVPSQRRAHHLPSALPDRDR